MIILQSPKLAKIHMKLGSIIFCDATFFVCPSFAYQLFIRRVFSSITNSYYFNEHIKLYLDINKTYEVKEIHTDFEIVLGKGCKNIYPNVKIKYCIFHMLNALDLKKIIYVKQI